MVRIEILRLARRVLVLVVLTTGLALAVSGSLGNKAGASAICCDQCFINYDNCYDNCNGNTACQQACYNTLVNCHLHCNPDC